MILFFLRLHLFFLYLYQFFLISWQALIQFTDAETASSARNALDGRSIPRHTLLSFPNLYNTPYFFIVISLGEFSVSMVSVVNL
jgi:hypothetical protein